MTGISGYEAAAECTKGLGLSEIPIIFLSSLDDAVDKARAFATRGVDYVTKPFRFPEVDANVSATKGSPTTCGKVSRILNWPLALVSPM
jgi:adenylate cyclase